MRTGECAPPPTSRGPSWNDGGSADIFERRDRSFQTGLYQYRTLKPLAEKHESGQRTVGATTWIVTKAGVGAAAG